LNVEPSFAHPPNTSIDTKSQDESYTACIDTTGIRTVGKKCQMQKCRRAADVELTAPHVTLSHRVLRRSRCSDKRLHLLAVNNQLYVPTVIAHDSVDRHSRLEDSC
jgi:hypothetical protein